MYRSVQLSRLPISLRESPPAKSRINFARFTNSAANDRLRARRFNSLRSGGANTSRFRFMHSIYQKCYTSHALVTLGEWANRIRGSEAAAEQRRSIGLMTL